MADNENLTREFDADTYFKSKGMTFVKQNPDGTAHVQYEDGSEGNFDPKALAKEYGLTPAKDFEATYNSPDAPVNESPVGVLDRLKMSFGNTKGSVNYLKNQFKDATVSQTGDLVVKDKGVWKRVDLDGLGDEEGWKVSEMIGDLADIGGDVAVGAGGLAAGLSTGGVAPAMALAAGGSGGASVAKAALGRVLGTYDATPQELVKDVALDTVLGAVGEGVALGAKSLVLPTIAKGLKKISGLGEATQDIMAKTLAAVDQENGADGYRFLFANGPEVTKLVKTQGERAAKRATLQGAEQTGKGGVIESASGALRTIAEEDAIQAAIPFIDNTQTHLSNWYGGQLGDIAEKGLTQAPAIESGIKQNAVKIQNDVATTLSNADIPLNKQGRVDPRSIESYMNKNGQPIDLPGARRLAVQINNLRSRVEGLANLKLRSKSDIQDVLRLSKDLQDVVELLPVGKQEQLSKLGFSTLQNLDTVVSQHLPKDVIKPFRELTGGYRERKAALTSLLGTVQKKGGADTWKTAGRRLVDVLKASTRDDAGAKTVLKVLEEITPNAAEQFQKLRLANSAMMMVGYKAAESATLSGAAARGIATGVRRAALPAANLVSKMQRKANLKGFIGQPGFQRFHDSARLIKSGGNTVLNNPELLGAGITTMLSALQEDQQ
jgi:hypothetical protein